MCGVHIHKGLILSIHIALHTIFGPFESKSMEIIVKSCTIYWSECSELSLGNMMVTGMDTHGVRVDCGWVTSGLYNIDFS